MKNLSASIHRHGAPGTWVLVALLAATFLIAWVSPNALVGLAFFPAELATHPWTALTYPFFNPGDGQNFLWYVVLWLWLWGMGGDVERRIGTSRMVGVWIAATLIGAVALALASLITPIRGLGAAGTMIPLGAVTVAWGSLNASAQVSLMLVLPISGYWLRWLTYGLVLFAVGSNTGSPLAGAFALIPLVLAQMYVLDQLPGLLRFNSASASTSGSRIRNAPKQDSAYFEDVKRRGKERDERERLRKLFESSISDDDEPK